MDLASKVSVFSLDKVFSRNVSVLDWLAHDKVLDAYIKSLKSNVVCSLLAFFRIYKESSTCHHVHITVLAANVHIDSFSIEFGLIALHIEAVDCEVSSTLDQYRNRIL